MEIPFIKQLENVLKRDERLIADNGSLLKNKAVELANKLDEDLVKILHGNTELKKIFFKKVGDLTLFDKDLFIEFVSNKDFLPDSYTAFKNKIGLAVSRDYLKQDKEVALVWPYKDCILEGGQTKEEAKRGEIFWNTTLAPDEINRLLEPKVLINWTRYDKDDAKKGRKATKISDTDNLIIKGNNLLALYSLKKRYSGRVKLIYIDPPFNTGNDSFKYNDGFNHSTWLTFMKNRLEVARELLAEDGSIFVHIDNNESHYLRVLMDEIFGRGRFKNQIIWEYSRWSVRGQLLPRFHDVILWYTKGDRYTFHQPLVPNTNPNPSQYVSAKDEFGKTVVLRDEKGNPIKREVAAEIPIGDVWDIPIISPVSKERIGFNSQKPEKLLQRIINMGTDKGDLVLDFFAGTGTTGAVAHKINRRYILVEQMDYIHDLPEARLKAVIEGDRSGISKEINWKGGGSFVYAELMPFNDKFVREIESVKSEKEMLKIWEAIQRSGFVSYRVDPKKFDENAKEFADLDLTKQKKFALESLDVNMLYVNYGDINDKEYSVSKDVKKLNKEFYEYASSGV